ncbi:hypothetical protein J4E83_005152 [Alternaria metachromatica]|uniref:uncharacterized protein n=1 Tax=Alternaria metachromatica TaxID=283354 RepID=UPI0020C1D2A7|nr:uncharacterized protein J4E83_005152 [Alternaria metachromatica]KAI4620791.1 hypothetical protein J4E83_005152 [Alternaria metachromatica]
MTLLLRRAPDIAGSSSSAAAFENRHFSEQTGQQNGRTSALVTPITLRSQPWSDQASGQSTTFDDVPITSNNETTANLPRPEPVTKRESRFASLFIALLAVSPMAVEYDAADQQTMEAAQNASVSATQPEAPKKTDYPTEDGIKKSEIRRTKWRRFKYEMKLKMRITGKAKGKDRWKWTQAEDMELEVLRSEERHLYTDMERQNSS